MLKNGKEKEQKQAPKRDELGRFVKGCSGGPGRGKKTKSELDDLDLSDLDSLDAVEKVARKDLMSDDPRIRQRAADSLIKLVRAKPPEAHDKFSLSPWVLDLVGRYVALTMIGGVKALKKMCETCPGCEKWPGIVINYKKHDDQPESDD